jgi:hypothetical protein
MSTTEEHVRKLANGATVKLCHGVKADGERCKVTAVQGRDYCIHHGGRALTGPESPVFKTGLWSKQRRRFASVAPKLLQRIEELREDPELFSLKDDAAYLTALMDVRAEAASNGISVEHYELIKDQMQVCKATVGTDEFGKAFKTLGKMIDEGIDVYKASQDVVALIEKRTDIVEAEARMLHTKAYTLEVDQAYSLAMQILGVVKKCVHDANQLQAIKEGFGKLLKQYQNEEDIQDAEIIDEESSIDSRNTASV